MIIEMFAGAFVPGTILAIILYNSSLLILTTISQSSQFCSQFSDMEQWSKRFNISITFTSELAGPRLESTSTLNFTIRKGEIILHTLL